MSSLRRKLEAGGEPRLRAHGPRPGLPARGDPVRPLATVSIRVRVIAAVMAVLAVVLVALSFSVSAVFVAQSNRNLDTLLSGRAQLGRQLARAGARPQQIVNRVGVDGVLASLELRDGTVLGSTVPAGAGVTSVTTSPPGHRAGERRPPHPQREHLAGVGGPGHPAAHPAGQRARRAACSAGCSSPSPSGWRCARSTPWPPWRSGSPPARGARGWRRAGPTPRSAGPRRRSTRCSTSSRGPRRAPAGRRSRRGRSWPTPRTSSGRR